MEIPFFLEDQSRSWEKWILCPPYFIHGWRRGMCPIPASEGKSVLYCTEFSEEFGDAPNSVTNSALICSPNSVTTDQVPIKAYFSVTISSPNSVMIYW